MLLEQNRLHFFSLLSCHASLRSHYTSLLVTSCYLLLLGTSHYFLLLATDYAFILRLKMNARKGSFSEKRKQKVHITYLQIVNFLNNLFKDLLHILHNEGRQQIDEEYVVAFSEEKSCLDQWAILVLKMTHSQTSGSALRIFRNFFTMKGVRGA